MARCAPPLLVLMLATSIAATKIQMVNLCEGSMQLYVGSHGAPTAIEEGASHSLELADGTNAAYRYGASYQATRACLPLLLLFVRLLANRLPFAVCH
jgi:hypothetical protein